jgi:Carboxypeptidase regulatory-like domain
MQITKILSLLILLLTAVAANAQKSQMTQQIKGTVIDGVLQKPLAGATVTLTTENRSTLTDSNGNFIFRNIPIGPQTLTISHVGYNAITQDNIQVEAGKETILTFPLETAPHTEQTAEVKATSRRNQPLNEMSVVSARAFSVEETNKYAAAVNDPLRMATSFAGVFAPFDGNNDIVIRGNSPVGLLWRMEGVEIPNPNHFSSPASSGGGISILSAQFLANSDFLTSAFPAQYGDALSGVFDLHLRKGNTEKNEYTLQAGALGLDVAAEGPLNLGGGGTKSGTQKGSYLVDYRYSTLGLLSSLGINVGTGSTYFQDLSYNIALPAGNAGNFNLFGFGGLSNNTTTPKKDSTKWKNFGDRFQSTYSGPTGFSGLAHTIFLDNSTSLHSVLGYSYTSLSYKDNYMQDNYTYLPYDNATDKTSKLTLTSNLDHRLDADNLLRTGYIVDFIHYNYLQQGRQSIPEPYLNQVNAGGSTQTVEAYTEWQGRSIPHFQFNAGLHYLELLFNHTSSIEPRASVKWEADSRNSFALGYGLHSQIQQLGVYFAQDTNAAGQTYRPNGNLGLTKAHHIVLSYTHKLQQNLSFKAEVYYQYLFNVPVNANDTNTYSTLNIDESDYVSDPLTNKGTGRNYGLELSLEKFLSNNLYYLVNGALYQSKYTALDGVERNTAFNGNYLFNGVAGKDFTWLDKAGKKKTIGVNIKLIYAGGYRNTPIDETASALEQKTVYYQKEAYTLQNPAYFRADLRISRKKDYRHMTTTLSLDLQNLTGTRNIYAQQYDPFQGKIVNIYQTGLIPVLNYKVEF